MILQRRLLTGWSGISGTACLVLASALGSWQFPEFDHASSYLSEVFAEGTPYGRPLRYVLMAPGGLLIVLLAFLSIKEVPRSVLSLIGFSCLALYGMECVLSNLFFPCDAGCNRGGGTPSLSQSIHEASGMIGLVAATQGLLMIGISARKWTDGRFVSLSAIVAGMTGIIVGHVLLADPYSTFAGLFQRIIEGSIVAWIVMFSVYLIRTPRRTESQRAIDLPALAGFSLQRVRSALERVERSSIRRKGGRATAAVVLG
jgi:hypothetical protein